MQADSSLLYSSCVYAVCMYSSLNGESGGGDGGVGGSGGGHGVGGGICVTLEQLLQCMSYCTHVLQCEVLYSHMNTD